ncbi:MAG TPA: radical SAM family heme chaperone HemW [Chitinophagaceae bacterium]
MAGIYIHIPFCKQACSYCNFHFATSLRAKNEVVQALLGEARLQASFLGGNPVNTIYLGGGTPSLLNEQELERILAAIADNFPVSPGAEITLEANPDDLDAGKLANWRALGVNRLSLGIQSFFDEDLRWMNRAHTAQQSEEALVLALAVFDNVTIDLIYGSPNLSDEHWRTNVNKAVSSGVPHLSCYALTMEPRTPLARAVRAGSVQAPSADDQSRQFLLLMEWLGAAGYEHYEISNFAKPGMRSRHNSAYWSGEHYLGLGPSAHSFNGASRQWNISNNAEYIRGIAENKLPRELETLTAVQKANEYVMTSLRTIEGLDLARFDAEQSSRLIKDAGQYVNRGLADMHEGRIKLTNEGKLFADGIAAALFFDEQ